MLTADPGLLFAKNLRSAGIPHAFTTRQGGVSRGPFASLNLGRGTADDPAAVAANRNAVLHVLQLDSARHVEADQVHGTAMAVVGAADAGRSIPQADGLITAATGLALAVHAADCISILLADPRRGVVAALHAGWRGVVAGIVPEGVRMLGARYGVDPGDLLVAMGPAIGACHYEVDEPVIEPLRRWPWWETVSEPTTPGRWRLDLRAACRAQFLAAGVRPEAIEVLDGCTFHQPELYYSYRRDRVTGRMAGIIALPG